MSELNDDMWEQIELNNYGKGKLIHIVNEQAELIRVMHDQLQQARRAAEEWYKVFGHLSKDADTAGNMINEGIAERDAEIEYLNKKVTNLKACIESWVKEFTIKHQQLATSQQEVERLKEESSHLWVRIESGEAAAYEQGKAEARKQAAQEIIEDVIGEWNCDCGYGGLVIADAIKAKFGLEG